MHKEMEGMTNEQMFTAIMDRMDAMEAGLNGRMDNLESIMDMEFKAVRTEMDVVYKMLKQDIFVLNDKVDWIMHTKDIDGYEKVKIQVELLTKGYQELKEKIG